MTSAVSSFSLSAFATPAAGSEYLATAEHYRHLASSVVDALSRGCLVLVTGQPPANPAMLAEALQTAMAPQRVIEISCSPQLDRASLFGEVSLRRDASPPDGATGTGGAAPPSPVFVFADADRLSDAQIKDLLEAMLDGLGAGVLWARSGFRARFESSALHPFEAAFAAHLSVQHLERDEVEAFIRYQLPPGDGVTQFTARRVALIALTSGGDPAVVNRAARRMLEIEPEGSAGGLSGKLSQAWSHRIRRLAAEKPNVEHAPSIASDEIARPNALQRRRGASLQLAAAIIIGFGAFWLIASELGSRDPGYLVALVRSHVWPREEADVSSHAAAAVPAEAAAGSSSVTVTAAPSAMPVREAAPAPEVPDAEQPSATSSPRSAPEPASRAALAEPRLAAEITALVVRGDAFLEAGDVVSARLFFERAADAGNGRAAMRMALTYDAAFLERAGVRGLRSDPERASFWYRRARELGEGKADQADRGPETGLTGAPPPR
jgi:hypothetical protein